MSGKKPEDRVYFFDKGLMFSCQKCGRCCTGDPGIVHLTKREAKKIAISLETNIEEMICNELLIYLDGYRLYENPITGACVFLNDQNGCRIYEDRPLQCKTWPWWIENLRSPKAWQKIKRICPGIGKGKVYSRDELLDLLTLSSKEEK